MEDVIANFGWKKTSAILIVLSIGTLVFIIFSLFGSISSTSKDLKPLPTYTPQPSSPNPMSSHAGWKRHLSRSFEVSFPADYTQDLTARQGSLESLVLHLPGRDATINIQSYSLQLTSASKISTIFSSLGYVKSPVTIGGVSGNKFSGSVLIKSPRLQEQAVVLEAKGVVYKIQLAYTSDTRDLVLEETFDKIVSTFSLL